MNVERETGLSEEVIDVIYREIIKNENIESVILFGSRAKGSYKPGSDIDLAIFGAEIVREDVLTLSYLLNQETNLPYHFDILNLSDADKEVQDHIFRVGIKIYNNEKN